MDGAHFQEKEHIFLASIGGRKCLPLGYVSDEFNNNISRIERKFTRKTFIADNRIFVGPGKRGSLKDKDKTKSEICFGSYEDNFSLGYYTSDGFKPLSSVFYNCTTGKARFITDEVNGTDYNELFSLFLQRILIELENDIHISYISHNTDTLADNNFIFALYNNAFYVGKNQKAIEIGSAKIIEILNKIYETLKSTNAKLKTISPEIVDVYDDRLIEYSEDDDSNAYFRIPAKIAFNSLAEIKGTEFVLDNRFDPLRTWICQNGKNDFCYRIFKSDNKELYFGAFPEQSHYIRFCVENEFLRCVISLYGGQHIWICNLAPSVQSDKLLKDIGLMCDWLNKVEYKISPQELISQTVIPKLDKLET
jgi:hypothetical protein